MDLSIKTHRKLRLEEFLRQNLDHAPAGKVIEWVHRDIGIFRILWTHQSSGAFTSNDAALFRYWAIARGKSSKASPVQLKQSLRMALNKSPSVNRIPHNPEDEYRYFQFTVSKNKCHKKKDEIKISSSSSSSEGSISSSLSSDAEDQCCGNIECPSDGSDNHCIYNNYYSIKPNYGNLLNKDVYKSLGNHQHTNLASSIREKDSIWFKNSTDGDLYQNKDTRYDQKLCAYENIPNTKYTHGYKDINNLQYIPHKNSVHYRYDYGNINYYHIKNDYGTRDYEHFNPNYSNLYQEHVSRDYGSSNFEPLEHDYRNTENKPTEHDYGTIIYKQQLKHNFETTSKHYLSDVRHCSQIPCYCIPFYPGQTSGHNVLSFTS